MAARSQSRLTTRNSKNSLLGPSSTNMKADTKSSKTKKTKQEEDSDSKNEALAFTVLSESQSKKMLSLSVESMETYLCEIFKLTNHITDLKGAAILDYYTAATWWGKEQHFTVQQLSGFFTLVHTLLDNIKEKHLSLVDNFKEFNKMLAGIGVDGLDISGGLEFFNINQAELITDYIHNSLFQHYKLYEYMFGMTQAEEIIGTDLEIDVPLAATIPFPPPLDEGVPLEIYTRFIAPSPPDPELQKKESEEKVIIPEGGDVSDISLPPDLTEDLFSELTVEDVKEVVESIGQNLLGGLQISIASKLREKENQIINRINKIHKVSEV